MHQGQQHEGYCNLINVGKIGYNRFPIMHEVRRELNDWNALQKQKTKN